MLKDRLLSFGKVFVGDVEGYSDRIAAEEAEGVSRLIAEGDANGEIGSEFAAKMLIGEDVEVIC